MRLFLATPRSVATARTDALVVHPPSNRSSSKHNNSPAISSPRPRSRPADINIEKPDAGDQVLAAIFGPENPSTNWHQHFRTWRTRRLRGIKVEYGDRLDEVAEFLAEFAQKVKALGPAGDLRSMSYRAGAPLDSVTDPQEGAWVAPENGRVALEGGVRLHDLRHVAGTEAATGASTNELMHVPGAVRSARAGVAESNATTKRDEAIADSIDRILDAAQRYGETSTNVLRFRRGSGE